MQPQPHEQNTPQLDAKVVEKLSSKKERERLEAEARLAQLGPEALDSLLALVKQEAAKRKKRRRIFVTIIVCYIVFVLGMAIIFEGKLDPALFNSIGSMSGLIGAAFAVSQAQRNAAKKLAEFEDIRVVGPLAEALEFGDKNIRAVAEDALIKLLPRLQASDASLLNEEQRACLNRALKGKNGALAKAILKAYEQVGDEKALPFVQKLAAGEGRAAKDASIRTAAQECLPYLEKLVAQQRASQTLLRAADAAETPPDVLLRPAEGGVSSTAPEQLLRASTPQGALEEPPHAPSLSTASAETGEETLNTIRPLTS
ncbi:MAG TPA: hypothetical protein VFB38_15940 [Chthonomonadaceae bacterium]|nr:hypothetical protein [Chthonomonadaceae bacterium]